MRFRLLAALVVLYALPAMSASDKTSVVIREGGKTYQVPPFILAGKALTVTSESKDAVRYSAPFGSRASLCELTIGGEVFAGRRLVADYAEFCYLKAGSFHGRDKEGDDAGVGAKPFDKAKPVREDQSSLIVSTRWKDDSRILYGATSLVLVDNLPLSMMVLARDRGDLGREREIEAALMDWADRVVAANPRLPRTVVVERAFQNIAVPAPRGYERYVVPGPGRDGWFSTFNAPRTVPADGTVPFFFFPDFDKQVDSTTSADSFRRLKQALEDDTQDSITDITKIKEGKKFFLGRVKIPGQPEGYMAFLFIKSRLLPIGYIPVKGGWEDPAARLDEWRLDIYRANLELPD